MEKLASRSYKRSFLFGSKNGSLWVHFYRNSGRLGSSRVPSRVSPCRSCELGIVIARFNFTREFGVFVCARKCKRARRFQSIYIRDTVMWHCHAIQRSDMWEEWNVQGRAAESWLTYSGIEISRVLPLSSKYQQFYKGWHVGNEDAGGPEVGASFLWRGSFPTSTWEYLYTIN